MGKGDLKTKRGKINRGTFGASRPKTEANKQTRRERMGQDKND